MRLKTRERYSLRMMMIIAKMSSKEAPMGLKDVSTRSGISRRYLEQLVPPLKNANLINATAGRAGGYTLSKPSDQILLSEIIEAAAGPIAVTECAVGSGDCMHQEFCHCRTLWTLVNYRIKKIFTDYTLADLMNEDWTDQIEREMEQT